MPEASQPQPSSESLELVLTEMRHRQAAQDAQAAALAAKAAFLFTAGTASVGAAGAFVAALIERSDVSGWLLLGPSLLAAVAYGWLIVGFYRAYRVRQFKRVPEPERLMGYLDLPADTAKTYLSDGRRLALQVNDRVLAAQAGWINHELVATVFVIGGLAVVLAMIALA